jgi:mannose-6-phosphate isomerase-like protein (cupin superfamily)
MPVLLSPAQVRAENSIARSELTALVAELAADRASWRSQVQHIPERRWWTRLVRNSRVDVWLITWPGHQHTDLHDHGASAAALTVVEGTLEHVLASRTGELSREPISAGTMLTIEPWAVHDLVNPSNTAAVSIHAYSPPLEQMTFFRRLPGRLEAVGSLRGDKPEIEQPCNAPGSTRRSIDTALTAARAPALRPGPGS